MTLQNIIFPNNKICTEEQLYLRCDNKNHYQLDEKALTVMPGTRVSFDTYFNSFCTRKWRKYTVVASANLHILASGNAVILIKKKITNGKTIMDDVETSYNFESTTVSEVNIPILMKDCEFYYFDIVVLSNEFVLYSASYDSDVLTPVMGNLAINICTYKREEYIKQTLKSISEEIWNDGDFEWGNKIDVYLTDNGATLKLEVLSSNDRIHFYTQRDSGASGGFTRGLIEILEQDDLHYSHILFMDDDVLVEPESIKRTYVFVNLLKSEWHNATLGGGFLKISSPNIQVESGGVWNEGKPLVPYRNLDMRNVSNLIKNEREETVDFHPWFYSCIPAEYVSQNNLPLPMFMKRDDIEYSLRNGGKYIQLNGICVWHEGYEFKYSSYIEFYIVRSTAIVNAIHCPKYDKFQYLKYLKSLVIPNIFRYKYELVETYFRAVKDFCGGVNRMKKIDGLKQYEELIALNYKKIPFDQCDIKFDKNQCIRPRDSKKGNVNKWVRRLTLNGALLPASKEIIVSENRVTVEEFYRVKRVLFCDEVLQKGCVKERNTGKSVLLLVKFLFIAGLILARYDWAKKDYQKRYQELTNVTFWRHYLGINKPQNKEGDP